ALNAPFSVVVQNADIEDASTFLSFDGFNPYTYTITDSRLLNNGTAISTPGSKTSLTGTEIGMGTTGIELLSTLADITLSMDRCKVHDTATAIHVGGSQQSSSTTITNSIFYANSAAALLIDASLIITSIQVSQSTLSGSGTAITVPGGFLVGGKVGHLDLTDSIVAFNQKGIAQGGGFGTPTATITYSDVFGNALVNIDPAFSP